MPQETSTAPRSSSPVPEGIDCSVSESFAVWMAQAGGSLLVTTYQAGKPVVVGWGDRLGQVSLLLRQFDKRMGVGATPDGRRPALATRQALALVGEAALLAHVYLEEHRGKDEA